MQINGVNAVVTGANGGLGQCLVDELLTRGARKVYATGRDRASLEAVGWADADRVSPLVLDITDATQAGAAAESAADATLVLNNAGVMAFGTPLKADIELIERDMLVNYLGTLRVARAFVPTLIANGGGTVVNILSLLALAPITMMSPYCASKAAAHSMTQELRHELADSSVSVLGVYPWGMNTQMLAGVDSPKAEPRDVACAVLDGVEAYAGWLADPKALESQLAAV